MYISSIGKRPFGLRVVLFGAALVFGAVLFSACPPETGSIYDDPPPPTIPGDPDDTGPTIPGESGNSGFTDDGITLPAPRSIQVTAKNQSLVLQWTKIAPAQGIIPTFEVWYESSTKPAGDPSTKGEDVTPGNSNLVVSTITGLTNGISYKVWVRAIYGSLGHSKFSPVEAGIPIPLPATPETLTVTPGEAMLQITWAVVPHAFTYEVYYKAGGSGGTPPADTAETMKTVSDPGIVLLSLSNNTNYRVWVRALNTAGNSPDYSANTGTPAATGIPTTAPGKPTVVPRDGKLALTWNQVPGVPYYKLYWNTADNFATATPVTETIPAKAPAVSAEIPDLSNGTLYYVWVTSTTRLTAA
ncbi:hypothetical protein AGMMS4952_26710 [Spirochaetia bacterium]|nr:hypothetical protein AGMMS4952_26710 [Spirochaetia bacterium]